jgi:hypothetical protein
VCSGGGIRTLTFARGEQRAAIVAGLVQKARGRAFWSHPYGLWVAAIASSVLWVWVFSADVFEDRQALLILASAVIVIASSVVGLIAAWQQRRLKAAELFGGRALAPRA